MNLSPRTVRLPPRQVIKDRTARGQVRRHRSPLTPATQHLQEPIEDFADIHRPLVAAPSRRRLCCKVPVKGGSRRETFLR